MEAKKEAEAKLGDPLVNGKDIRPTKPIECLLAERVLGDGPYKKVEPVVTSVAFESWDETCQIASQQKEDWLIPGWAEFGCLQLLTGLPFSGKSCIVAEIIAALALGKTFCELPVQQVPFVLLDLENKERILVKRLRNALGGEAGKMPELYHRVNPRNIPRPITPQFILTAIDKLKKAMGDIGKKGFVVIDTMRSAFAGSGKDELNPQQMIDLLVPLKQLAYDSGWLVLVLHHNAKHSDQYSGSTAIAAVADYMWNWSSDKKKLTGTLEFAGGRDDHQLPLDFTFDMTSQRNVFIGSRPEVVEARVKQKRDTEIGPWLGLLPDLQADAIKYDEILKRAIAAGLVKDEGDACEQFMRRRVQMGINDGYVSLSGNGRRNDPYVFWRSQTGSDAWLRSQVMDASQ